MSATELTTPVDATIKGAAGVYQIRNMLNGKIYIGSCSLDLNKRWNHHEHLLGHGDHFNRYLQRAWKKYGSDAFEFEVLITCHPSMCLWYEQQFLDQWKPEYNICSQARSRRGVKVSEETRVKISVAQKGRAPSPETIKKMLKAREGFRHSEATKEKLRVQALARWERGHYKNSMVGHRDRPITEEEKHQISEGLKAAWARGDYDDRAPRNSRSKKK